VRLAPTGVPRLDEAHVDWRVLTFSFALSAATGVLFGMAPAIRLSRELNNTRSTAGNDARGLRCAFVIIEVALAAVLLTGAGLLVRSLISVESIKPGFQTSHVLSATLRFRNNLPRERRAALYGEAITSIRELPGVTAAGAISTMFYTGD